jgi:hypothetical protein
VLACTLYVSTLDAYALVLHGECITMPTLTLTLCYFHYHWYFTSSHSILNHQLVEEIFDSREDRGVLEDRALMLLLSKIPEAQTMSALRKYQSTVQQRGRASINNPCGYLISLLKKAQVRAPQCTIFLPPFFFLILIMSSVA